MHTAKKRMHVLKKFLEHFNMNRKRYISSRFSSNLFEMVELSAHVKSITGPLLVQGQKRADGNNALKFKRFQRLKNGSFFKL